MERALWLTVTRRATELRVQLMKAHASHVAARTWGK